MTLTKFVTIYDKEIFELFYIKKQKVINAWEKIKDYVPKKYRFNFETELRL